MSKLLTPSTRRTISRLRVVVVGDLLADHYLFARSERVSREAPALILRHESDDVRLGGAANVAAGVRALGAKVTVVGVLGRDAMGATMQALLKERGIASQAVLTRGHITETRTRVLAGSMGTTWQQMLRIDRGATAALPTKVQRLLARRLAASKADLVLVSDYGAGVVGEVVREAVAKLAQTRFVAVDSRSQLAAFEGMGALKPNAPELAALSGYPTGTEAELRVAAEAVQRRLRPKHLLVTRGRDGLALFSTGKPACFIPPHGPRNAVDVTGAGDTVLAAFGVGLASGLAPAAAAHLANVAGALVVQSPGTATVSFEELRRELA